ncbi:MAG TPA: UDP-N-acetylglucosamine 1-carboxyvinyltransferase [Candidatus Blautia stercoravium]|nr:UDP-N-acetylglucosamine 1-carboxyvinyltransferase [Candidatus Blautia stercoravium]
MAGIKITGGIPLSGELKIQGSKNAALPMMAAALLNKGVTVLHGCPKIADVFVMEEILKKLGVKAIWEGHTLLLDAEQVTGYEVDRKLGCQMRSSIVLLGSLLGRCGQACVPYPGGCVIGKRPVDLHLAVLEAMGAEFQEGEMLCARAGKRKESRYHFPKSSVGAAQNAILAAVCAPGITWLSGCSKEPEVSWLCRFLNQAGARIEGVGSEQLKITGVRNLHDTEFQVPADRIAAGTYVCAAAITRGNCVLDQAPVEEMGALLAAYEKIGGQYTCNSGKLILSGQKADGFVPYLQTAVYPGFPTDLQSVFLAVLAASRGESCLVETVFEDRFKPVYQLQRMGADISVFQNCARVRGGVLTGNKVWAEELRGGAALVLAGLAARGETCVENRHYIERGYEDICRDLTLLGAQIFKD